MAVPDYSTYTSPPSAPAQSAVPVLPENDYDLPDGACRSLWVTVTGNLRFVAENDADGDALTIPVVAGQHLPIRVRRVLSTATTATVIALY